MLSNIEIGAFLNFYNRSGYVLDFSTASFDSFTMQSIGVPLCQRYQMSKGKSLMAYCDDADYDDVFKLLADLLEYYELNCMELYGEDKYKPQYERCRKIMDRELGAAIKIDTPAIACVNRDYIKDIAARANRDVDNGESIVQLLSPESLIGRGILPCD